MLKDSGVGVPGNTLGVSAESDSKAIESESEGAWGSRQRRKYASILIAQERSDSKCLNNGPTTS